MPAPTDLAKIYRPTCRKFAACVTAFAILALCLFTPPPPVARAQSGPSGMRISQIYTRGGESGAAFRSDFVEIFNGGTAPVDINEWSVYVKGLGGDPSGFGRVFLTSQNAGVEPGHFVLVRMGSGGTNGSPLPQPDASAVIFGFEESLFNMNADSAQVALLRKGAPDPPRNGCPVLPSDGIEDYVGYGNSVCSEGGQPAPAPGLTTALVRRGGGCVETNNNAADFQVLDATAPRNSSTTPAPCADAAQLSFINFAFPSYLAFEQDGRKQVLVKRTGDASAPATVDYVVTPGTASERSDYTSAAGRLRFAAGETQKSFDVLLTDDAMQEQDETAEMTLSNVTGAGVSMGLRDKVTLTIRDNDSSPSSSNPIDDSFFFVRQHYHDFLGREPDSSGWAFWIQNIESCGSSQSCREVKRIDTSAAFFLSIEFQRTGFLVHRLYRAALPETPSRVRSLPRYDEFVRDTQELQRGVIVGQAGWEQKLEVNTQLLLEDFITRPEFVANYPAQLAPADYVDRLNSQAGGPLSQSERDALVAGLTAGQETRASVLRKVAESGEFARREFNHAFVLMQYFGYLRRGPNDAPDVDFSGFDFWLTKLERFGGDFHAAEMVKAFTSSVEYRARFGAVPQ